jgi:hypothetical protein
LKNLFCLIFIVLIYSCANQLPPTGGPVDKEAPEIISYFPNNGTTNFDADYFEFNFSEYVDKRSFQDAFFISPKIDSKFNYDWSGKSVKIFFDKSKLKPNTTYNVNIGTDLYDLNNRNKLAKSLNLFFSTGEKIDEGRISGKVFFSDNQDAFIFAYKNNSDTLNPSKTKPDYLTQVGKDGSFSLFGLGYGNYKIFAFTDELRNLFYNLGEDKYGVPFKDIELSDKNNLTEEVNFILSIEDTLKPSVTNVTMTDRNHILAEFNEYIDSTKLTSKNFYIIDSTNNNKLPIKYVFRNNKPKTYYLCIEDSLIKEREYYLVVENIIDLSGNLTTKQELYLTPSFVQDTLKPKVVNVLTKYENKTIDFVEPYFYISFNDGVNISDILNECKVLTSKSEEIESEAIRIDDAQILIKLKNNLKPKTKLKFRINTDKIFDAAKNNIDSLVSIDLITVDDLIFSGVSGKVKSKNSIKKNVCIVNKERSYKSKVNEKGIFNFSNILPGKYILWIYEDVDSNDVYTHGKVFPYKKSEKFYVFPDTLNLRARWPVGDIEIEQD